MRNTYHIPNYDAAGHVLLELARRSNGADIGSTHLRLHEMLSSIPASQQLKGWGKPSYGEKFTQAQEHHAWKHIHGYAKFDNVVVTEGVTPRFVRVRAKAGIRKAVITEVSMAGKPVDPERPNLFKSSARCVSNNIQAALVTMADHNARGDEMCFDSYRDKTGSIPIWDALNSTESGIKIDGWGRGRRPAFTSNAKVHIHTKMKDLCRYEALYVGDVGRSGTGYVRVREVAPKSYSPQSYDSLKTTFVVEYCKKNGSLVNNNPIKKESMEAPHVAMFEKTTHLFDRPGNVYALVNPSMPGLFKIGRTNGEPEARAHVLSKGTNMPTPFEVHSYVVCSDYVHSEKTAHIELADYRVSGKEFFRAPESRVLSVLDHVGTGKVTCTGEQLTSPINPFEAVVPPPEVITKEMVISSYLEWVRLEHDLQPKDIILSKRGTCTRLRIGSFGGEDDWVTVPFGSLKVMRDSTNIHMDARKKVFNQYACI